MSLNIRLEYDGNVLSIVLSDKKKQNICEFSMYQNLFDFLIYVILYQIEISYFTDKSSIVSIYFHKFDNLLQTIILENIIFRNTCQLFVNINILIYCRGRASYLHSMTIVMFETR